MERRTVGEDRRIPNLIGVREASTFPGFCQKHDDRLFAPVEKDAWTATLLQVGLLGYRAICHELLAKKSVTRGFKALIHNLPNSNTDDLRYWIMGSEKAVEELEQAKKEYGQVIMSADLHRISSYVIELGNIPEVMCNAAAQTTHDFRGNRLASLADFGKTMNWTTFSLAATNTGKGIVVFSWLTDPQALNERMVST